MVGRVGCGWESRGVVGRVGVWSGERGVARRVGVHVVRRLGVWSKEWGVVRRVECGQHSGCVVGGVLCVLRVVYVSCVF